jgi:hypothetical protein
MLNATDEKVVKFLATWKENMGKVGMYQDDPELLDEKAPVAVQKQKYILLNSREGVGHFLVDRDTEVVYSIKGYGVINRKKSRGTIEFLTRFIANETASGREYTHKWWYDLHPTEGL